MNERIRELAELCTEIIDSTACPAIKDFDYEKFAELIVRECIEYYRSQIGKTSEPHTKTLEHFGVEE